MHEFNKRVKEGEREKFTNVKDWMQLISLNVCKV